ncbi:MAG: transposase [Candidatus Omnitrophota bacterium]|nr:transposase [Candidatus Omnitrophota bacterium]
MKSRFINEQVYHIFTKSIAGFKICNNTAEFSRMLDVIKYYQYADKPVSFFRFKNNSDNRKNNVKNITSKREEKIVEIICYCLMSTHIHLVLKQLKDRGISVFMSNILNSYSRYFNIKHNRKGPLWEGRFKRVLVEAEEQLIHLTRYVHLNPVTANLVNNPIDWEASSYKEYLGTTHENNICKYDDVLDTNSNSYRKFVEERIDYQKELARIKHLILEEV